MQHLNGCHAIGCVRVHSLCPPWARSQFPARLAPIDQITAAPSAPFWPTSARVYAPTRRTARFNFHRLLDRITRKPTASTRLLMGSLSRLAARSVCGKLLKDAPRRTRRLQSPVVLGPPSPGLPAFLSFQQSSVHSQTLPCTLYSPHGLALTLSTGTVALRHSPLAPPPWVMLPL